MGRILLLVGALVVLGARETAAQVRAPAGSVEALGWRAPGAAAAEPAGGRPEVDGDLLRALQARRAGGSWARRGAVLGAVAGGVATYLVIHRGGSTSLCDRSANQDAMGKRECVVLTVAGGAAGAGLGAWIGSRFPRE